MASIFEKTMAACLESKRTNKATSKLMNEKLAKSKKIVKESEESEEDLLGVENGSEEVMDDVVDDIVVVTDPEIDVEDIDDVTSELQDIVDETPEGEVPTTDEYVGDYTYTCPICGSTFFSDIEMNEGDECPVCGDFPSGYVLVGAVQDPAEVVAEDETPEDVEVATDDIVEEPEAPVEDETEEELVPDVEEEEEVVEEESFKRAHRRVAKERFTGYSLDESTFNPFMTKFIRENYKNAKSFVMTGAKLAGRTLTIECKVTFKSGKSKNVLLKAENFKAAPKMIIAARDNGFFKVESKGAKVAPFVFSASMNRGIIKCEGLKYNFITSLSEGKRAQVSGKLVKESKARR